jgi:hypothetical protein
LSMMRVVAEVCLLCRYIRMPEWHLLLPEPWP